MAQKKWMRANNAHSPLLEEVVDLYRHDEVSPFWQKEGAESGYYTDLNNIYIPSDAMIAAYQLKRIMELQNASLSIKEQNYVNDLNQLFLNGDINNLTTDFEKNEKMKINEEITKMVQTMNETYSANKGNSKYDYDLLQQKLLKLQSQLQMLQQKLNISNNSVYGKDLILIDNAIKECGLKGLTKTAIKEWYTYINNIKGELLEEIGTAWLGKLNLPIPKTIAINTGSLHLNTQKSERHSGQLIQDLMVLNVDGVDLQKIPVTYSVKDERGQKHQINTTLQGLLDEMKNNSGKSTKIVIPDATYDTLLEYSALNIQAKAGLNQTPWNANKSTQVSIQDFKDEAKLNGIGVKRVFMLLHTLKQEPVKSGHKQWVKQYSPDGDYNAIANYGLATVLSKILHLSNEMGSNQFLLTPSGFTTYTKRISELMAKHKTAITISSSVAITNDTLTRPYNAFIPKKW